MCEICEILDRTVENTVFKIFQMCGMLWWVPIQFCVSEKWLRALWNSQLNAQCFNFIIEKTRCTMYDHYNCWTTSNNKFLMVSMGSWIPLKIQKRLLLPKVVWWERFLSFKNMYLTTWIQSSPTVLSSCVLVESNLFFIFVKGGGVL